MHYKKYRSTAAFTLIEVLLVIAILSFLALFIAPVMNGFLINTYFHNNVSTVISTLHTAQQNSISGRADGQWGVNISPSAITLYKGANYGSRQQSFDQVTDIPSSINITNTDVVFKKVTGQPPTARTITVSSQTDTKVITIQQTGIIDVN